MLPPPRGAASLASAQPQPCHAASRAHPCTCLASILPQAYFAPNSVGGRILEFGTTATLALVQV